MAGEANIFQEMPQAMGGTEHDTVKLSTVQIFSQPQSDRLHHHMWRYCVCVCVGGGDVGRCGHMCVSGERKRGPGQ